MNLQGGSFAAGWEHVMNDMFARKLAKDAYDRARKLEDELHVWLQRAPRPDESMFAHRCGLCGQPSGAANYCPEHSWAERAP